MPKKEKCFSKGQRIIKKTLKTGLGVDNFILKEGKKKNLTIM